MVAPLVDNLTPKQEAAVTALLTETTVERAAKVVDDNRRAFLGEQIGDFHSDAPARAGDDG